MLQFPALEQQAQEAAERVRHGNQLILSGRGRDFLLRRIASQLNGQALVVDVPRSIDAHWYALLSITEQANPSLLPLLREQLFSSDISASIDTVTAAIGSKSLLILERSSRVDASAFEELRAVVSPQLDEIESFLFTKASARATRIGGPHAISATFGEPISTSNWNSSAVWALCNKNIELYSLAATSHLLGRSFNDILEFSPEESARRLMLHVLTDPLSSLLKVLIVHGRPLPRQIVEDEISPSWAIDRSLNSFLVENTNAGLVLAPLWYRSIEISPSERSGIHRKLATAFKARQTAMTPQHALEACRHYASIPDIDSAKSYAEICIPFLLQHARALSISGKFEMADGGNSQISRASAVYDVVLNIDEELQGSSVANGIGSRQRAYAIHYKAYNRYRAGFDNIENTLAAYREAIGLWRGNALFWSRLISGYFIADQYESAQQAIDHAWSAVAEHPDKISALVEKTIHRLLTRGLIGPAIMVWGERSPNSAPQTFDELMSRTTNGWREHHLWAPAFHNLWFTSPLSASLQARGESFNCVIDDIEISSISPKAALMAAASALHSRILALVLSETLEETELRELQKLDRLRLSRGSESERYLAFFAQLQSDLEEGALTSAQHSAFLRVLREVMMENLRHPAIGYSYKDRDGHALQLSWSFTDIPYKSFTLDIFNDGRLEWFFCDNDAMEQAGTEDEPEERLPPLAFEHLKHFKSSSPEGKVYG